MASQAAEANILAKQRLQQIIATAVATAWANLPHYDREQVDEWLSTVLPLTAAANRQAVAQTQAFIAHVAKTSPPPVDAQQVIADIRNGTSPETVYTRPFITVWGALKAGVPWAQAVRMGRDRAVVAASTDVQLTFTNTLAAAGNVGGITGWERVPDASACDFCVAASGMVYKTGDLMPLHSSCVAGSTIVRVPASRGPDDPDLRGSQALTRRWYAGEIVSLETAAGHLVTLTPNHPILTGHGWVAAGELREGDGVIRYAGPSWVNTRVPDEDQVPACIEDRFRTGAMTAPEAMPFSAKDFHGDIGDGEVDVVLTNRNLNLGLLAPLFEPIHHPSLGIGLGLALQFQRPSALGQSFHRSRAASARCVCCGGPRFAYLGRQASVIDQMLLRRSAEGDSLEDQVALDRAPINAVALREREDGLPGEIALDSVRHARRMHWEGHVFNLVTGCGWYVSNGIVTHNCLCGVEPVTGGFTPAPTRFPGVNGAPEVAVRQHGELGPVLTQASDHFAGPSVVPH